MIANSSFVACLQVMLITAEAVCRPGGFPSLLASLACHTGSSNLCKDYPVGVDAENQSLGPSGWPSCAVCKKM